MMSHYEEQCLGCQVVTNFFDYLDQNPFTQVLKIYSGIFQYNNTILMCVMNIAMPCLDKWIATCDTQKSNKSV